jgi:hypothetical protein
MSAASELGLRRARKACADEARLALKVEGRRWRLNGIGADRRRAWVGRGVDRTRLFPRPVKPPVGLLTKGWQGPALVAIQPGAGEREHPGEGVPGGCGIPEHAKLLLTLPDGQPVTPRWRVSGGPPPT